MSGNLLNGITSQRAACHQWRCRESPGHANHRAHRHQWRLGLGSRRCAIICGRRSPQFPWWRIAITSRGPLTRRWSRRA